MGERIDLSFVIQYDGYKRDHNWLLLQLLHHHHVGLLRVHIQIRLHLASTFRFSRSVRFEGIGGWNTSGPQSIRPQLPSGRPVGPCSQATVFD